jgi:hypothetical protein
MANIGFVVTEARDVEDAVPYKCPSTMHCEL